MEKISVKELSFTKDEAKAKGFVTVKDIGEMSPVEFKVIEGASGTKKTDGKPWKSMTIDAGKFKGMIFPGWQDANGNLLADELLNSKNYPNAKECLFGISKGRAYFTSKAEE